LCFIFLISSTKRNGIRSIETRVPQFLCLLIFYLI
jgi:hypothetical protein